MDREPWQIAATRHLIDQSETGTTEEELAEFLESNDYQMSRYQIARFWEEEVVHPTGRTHARLNLNQNDGLLARYQPSLELVQKITDYDEITLARVTSQEAAFYSRIAISIAFTALIASLLIPILYKQTVKIDQEQLENSSIYFKTEVLNKLNQIKDKL